MTRLAAAESQVSRGSSVNLMSLFMMLTSVLPITMSSVMCASARTTTSRVIIRCLRSFFAVEYRVRDAFPADTPPEHPA